MSGDGGSGGNKFFEAPGVAGCTTSALQKKGIPNICMADGPAGLRLQKVSAVTRRGTVKGTEPNVSVMGCLPEPVKKVMLGNPERQPCVYQFTTSFPVGTALAQTWNTELIEGGRSSRKRNGSLRDHLLACSRYEHTQKSSVWKELEYFSEDPLLTGKMAAAMSRGFRQGRAAL